MTANNINKPIPPVNLEQFSREYWNKHFEEIKRFFFEEIRIVELSRMRVS